MTEVYKDGEQVNELLSSIGNAFFSGISFQDLWNCIEVAEDRQELDAAISATIQLNQLLEENLDKSERW